MHLLTVPDAHAAAETSAAIVATALRATPTCNVVAATGATPMATYDRLADLARSGACPTERMTVFQLDEYVGLDATVPGGDRRSLVRWTRERILVPLGVPDDRFVSLPGTPGDVADPTDVDAACRAYDSTVRAAGGFDLAILGLGPNGHLGFNEPPSSAEAPTRRVALTDESLASNAVYWGGRDVVPREAVTAGMDLLLAARTILLIVTGARKRDILHRTLHGPVDPRVPASFLQRCPQAIVVADAAAVGAQAAGPSEAVGP